MNDEKGKKEKIRKALADFGAKMDRLEKRKNEFLRRLVVRAGKENIDKLRTRP